MLGCYNNYFTMETDNSCNCDPIKIILNRVLQEIFVEFNVPSSELVNTSLIYRSSVFRYRIYDGKLGIRLLQETVKFIWEWAQDTLSTGKSSDTSITKFADTVENVMTRVKSLEMVNILGYTIKSVIPDSLGNFNLTVDVGQMANGVIRYLVRDVETNICHRKLYRVEVGAVTSNDEASLREFRKLLSAQAISSVAKKVGYQVDEDRYTCLPDDKNHKNTIFVTGEPIADTEPQKQNLLVADIPLVDPEGVLQYTVGNVSTLQKDPDTLNELLSDRLKSIKEISEARRLDSIMASSWVSSVYNLATATLHYDILSKSIETDVQLSSLETRRMNHDALFIMYNYSRLQSILRKFEEQVKNGEYPPLPSVDEVQFTSICSREEEVCLLQLLMEWPMLLESVINFLRLDLNLSVIPKFLFALAKAFNSFYPEIVVLVPTNGLHNFPTMMARIYLIKTVCRVFETCLDVMQIHHANTKTQVPENSLPD